MGSLGSIRRLKAVVATAVIGAVSTTLALIGPAAALANTSHAGWPPITGMLLINKYDQSRPLDGRPGSDPFDGTDYSASCPLGVMHSYCVPNGIPVRSADGHNNHGVTCTALEAAEAALTSTLNIPLPSSACTTGVTGAALIPPTIGHNELLGGGGNDVIHAGPAGDVIWGDYKPNDNSTHQIDHLYGGPGNDFIYTSHGLNYVDTGGGYDVVHAHFGHGDIHCNSASVTVYLSRADEKRWKLFGCKHISHTTLGY
jgi:hemolysin type calcium-binding protein